MMRLHGWRQPALVLACLAIVGCAVHAGPAAAPEGARWVASWGTSQLTVDKAKEIPPEFWKNGTLRQPVRLSIGGSKVRVRFSNQFGSGFMSLSGATIGLVVRPGSADVAAGSMRPLLFAGRTAVSIPPGAEYYSDPVDMAVAGGADLAISMQLAGSPGQQTGHGGSRATSFLAPGAQAGALVLQDAQPIVHWHQLADVEVHAAPDAHAVVAIGDSITDGYGTTTDGYNRWTDVLVRRLGQNKVANIAVINTGIGGGRLLRDGAGPHLISRFDRDVLSRTGVSHAIVMIGVNDMGVLHRSGGDTPEAQVAMLDDLKMGFAQLIERAHAKGVCLIGGTVTPYTGSGYYKPSAENEAMRQALNQWIRSGAGFDAVADFDLALRDPAKPTHLAKNFDNDGLHPSHAGLAEIAATVPLAALNKCRFSPYAWLRD
jgi:lysophospholipase L1-like esterase